jgi:hypothetical protein
MGAQVQEAYWYEAEPERVPSVQVRDWDMEEQRFPTGAVWEE